MHGLYGEITEKCDNILEKLTDFYMGRDFYIKGYHGKRPAEQKAMRKKGYKNHHIIKVTKTVPKTLEEFRFYLKEALKKVPNSILINTYFKYFPREGDKVQLGEKDKPSALKYQPELFKE